MLPNNIIDRILRLRFLTGDNNTGGCFGTFNPRQTYTNTSLKEGKSPYAVKMIFDKNGNSYFIPDKNNEINNPYEIKTVKLENGLYKISD